MHGIVDIEWWRLALVALIVVALLALSRKERLGVERELLVAFSRGPTQLLLLGFVLAAIFAIDRWELVLAILFIMLAFASRTVTRRLSRRVPGSSWFAAAALALGTSASLVFMAEVVVDVEPWYDPQYLIPFGGMLLGNSLNGAALAGERFQSEVSQQRQAIEARLALGFSGREALHPIVRRTVAAALMPSLNALMVAGVVQLPGMMTGQILSGVDPIVAVKYQILIFALLMLSVALTTVVFLRLLLGRYVTPAEQLRRI